jgi:hypothetical protein
VTPAEAHRQISRLCQDLERLVDRDPEQEVEGMAISVVDAVLSAAGDHASTSPALVETVRGLITPEAVADGLSFRAADLLVVAGQLEAALRPRKGGAFLSF